ncbi:MAG: hypothetical protein JRF29_01840 [Deltaproteobacteria bacterium]|nr:hypothetical protein [Deltaproteobacteria bacterium]
MCHKIRKFYLFPLIFISLVLNHSSGMAEDNVILDELLTEVQKTLIRVSTSLEENDLPPLNKITLQLKSALVTKADGKVSLLIVKLGADVTQEVVQEINLELKPPKPSDSAMVQSIEDTLATAIIEAAKSANRASKRKPPLHLSKLTAKIRFVVKTAVGGGVNFKLLPVTVKLGGQVRDVTTQQIVIEFKS